LAPPRRQPRTSRTGPELAKALAGKKVTLEDGLKASEGAGRSISAKFEVENGKLQLSVYAPKGDAETYALTRDIVAARPLPAITVKGIARPIVPYAVDGLISETRVEVPVVNEHADGLDVYIDIEGLDVEAADRAVRVLRSALDRIEARRTRQSAGSD
jgi:hypothetical protein